MSPSGNTKTSSSPQLKNRRHVLRACTKHSDHSLFCPVHDLSSSQQFKDRLRCASAVRLVQGISRLVVHVKVGAQTGAGEGLVQRTCSGVVTSVSEDDVVVTVPLHAVQGDVQVVDTTADFFHDSEDDSDSIITVRAKALARHDLQHIAQLTCHSHPELKQRYDQRNEEDMTLTFEALTSRLDSDPKRRLRGVEAVLISHPHGFSKRATFGNVCGWEVVNRRVGDDQTFSEFCDDGGGEVTLVTSSGQRGRSLSMSDAVVTSVSSPPSSGLSSQLSSLASPSESSRSSLRPSQSAEKQKKENAPGTATPLWSKILPLWSGPATLCARIVSLCSDLFTRVVDGFRRILLNVSDEDSAKVVRVYHSCASCPGSSGGAVILIGCPGVARLDESVTSLPVYLHVGVREGQGVAVLVRVSRGALNLCFRGRPRARTEGRSVQLKRR